MLADAFCNPVLPAQNGPRARTFYRDVLGLTMLSGPSDDPMFFQAGSGTALVVTEIPGRTPPPYQMVSFMVESIDQIVNELARRGVEFVEPEASSFAGVEGVIRGPVIDYGPVRSAVFRDTEGNLLALNEMVQAS